MGETGLDVDEYELLTFTEQYFLAKGEHPNEAIAEQFNYDKKLFRSCVKNELFNKALAERGITPYIALNADGSTKWTLTPQQLRVANCILNLTDNRSKKKKLTDLGIPSNTYESWLRDPNFTGYLRARGEALLGDIAHEAHQGLAENVRRGDLASIKYFNEITGRYVPAAEGKGVDVRSLLIQVIEIIQVEVADLPTQQRIADKLIAIAKGSAGVPQFNGQPTIAVPAVKTREPVAIPKDSTLIQPTSNELDF